VVMCVEIEMQQGRGLPLTSSILNTEAESRVKAAMIGAFLRKKAMMFPDVMP